ncbi:MAG: helix-turn-helix domain-containing protein [Pseudonocardiaceae bacterium]
METLLKTGEVAQLLGVSRQHVANLCDRGEIACVYVGTHRRVPSSEAERLVSPALTREEEKSLWLHRALLTPMMAETDAVMSKARQNLNRWAGMHRHDGMTMRYFTKWEHVLNAGIDAAMQVMTSPSAQARELRQNSPFAGVLPEETRARVLQSFNEHWSREHEPDLAA